MGIEELSQVHLPPVSQKKKQGYKKGYRTRLIKGYRTGNGITKGGPGQKNFIYNLLQKEGRAKQSLRIWFKHQTVTQDFLLKKEEQSPSVIKVKSTYLQCDPPYLRVCEVGALLLRTQSLQLNLAYNSKLPWGCVIVFCVLVSPSDFFFALPYKRKHMTQLKNSPPPTLTPESIHKCLK